MAALLVLLHCWLEHVYSANSTVFIARQQICLSVRLSSFISIKHLHEIPTGSPPAGRLI